MPTGHENGGWMNDDQRSAARSNAAELQRLLNSFLSDLARLEKAARDKLESGEPFDQRQGDFFIAHGLVVEAIRQLRPRAEGRP